MIIYLMGQISADPRTYSWRENVRNIAKESTCIEIIDPCANILNQGLMAHKNDEKKFSELARQSMPMGMLPPLDLGYVKRSTLGFINMNHYTPSRPILGSYFELAWYYALCPDKPVIAVFDGDPAKDYQCNHPFVQATVHVWFKNEYEAMTTITKQCF